MTSINQHQWQVPLPSVTSLANLRSEFLQLGAEYIWVDVLCLRQHSESLDQLKHEEWKLDVPTIGNIYRVAERIIRYFNGLGVQFRNEDWDSPYHWLHRAWTLQEISKENTTFNGGIPRDRGRVLMNTRSIAVGSKTTLRRMIRPILRLAEEVDSPHGCSVYDLSREMAKRYSSTPIDKVFSLLYLLRPAKFPC